MTIEISGSIQENSDIVVSHKKTGDSYIDVPHMHSQYEIYYNIHGAKCFMCEGRVYACNSHNLIIVPKIYAHKVFVEKGAEYERCIISVDESVIDMLSMLCQSDECFSWLTDVNLSNVGVTKLSESENNVFVSLVEKYTHIDESNDKLLSLACFIKILAFLKKCFDSPQSVKTADMEALTAAERAIVLIEQKFKTITVTDVCRGLYFSEDHLNRIFKAETGMTVKQYITVRKLTEAKKYLYLGKSAKEACFLSGFRDYSNFRRTFKNYEGYNPGNLEELTSPI
ncbi:MAG: helix-turn-helix domain-containing protein [Ruminococcaceae bacterium]|nr:helix-turn-helix domain-containing protein [Oscillospiraceae bacterium]